MSKNRHHRHPPVEGRDAVPCGLVLLPPEPDAEALRATFAPSPRYDRVFVTSAEMADVLNARAESGWRVAHVHPERRSVGREWVQGFDVLLERA